MAVASKSLVSCQPLFSPEKPRADSPTVYQSDEEIFPAEKLQDDDDGMLSPIPLEIQEERKDDMIATTLHSDIPNLDSVSGVTIVLL